MKKVLFVLFLVLLAVSCEKEEPGQNTSFINFTFKFDTGGEGIKCKVYLFDIGNNKFNPDYYVQFAVNPPVMLDVNTEVVFPVYSSYEVTPSKGEDGKYINETKHSIFWEELSFPGQSGDFLIVVKLSNGKYQYSTRETRWNSKDNITLSKTFTRDWVIPYVGHNREKW